MGDNKGILRVFQIVNESAHLTGSYKIQSSKQVKMEQALGIGQHNVGARIEASTQNESIKEIHITQNEQFAVVTFSSGIVSVYDVKNGFSFIGDIDDSDLQKLNTQSVYYQSESARTIVLEYGKTTRPGSRASANFSANYGSTESSMKVITMQTPNQI